MDLNKYWQIPILDPKSTSGRNPLWDNFRDENTNDAHTFVRELLQNVLDNRIGTDNPATIEFKFRSFKENSFLSRFIAEPLKHKNACEDGSGILSNNRFLVIHESGTTGFKGVYNDSFAENSDFINFFYGAAKEDKLESKNGSAGQGKITYFMASESRSLLVLTKRNTDKKILCMGRASFTKTHKINNKPYSYDGWFALEGPNSQPLPFEDMKYINEFCKELDVDLGKLNSGNVYVIPLPVKELTDTAIIQTAIQDFFYPILKNKLILNTETTSLNKANLLSVYKDHEEHFDAVNRNAPSRDFLGFISECASAPPNITLENTWDGKPDSFREHLSEENIKFLQTSFVSEEITSLSIPIKVKNKENKEEISKLYVYLLSKESIKKTEEAYVRRDLYVAEEKKLRGLTNEAFGLVVSEDGMLSNFLANAEVASHQKWNPNQSKVKERYKRVKETLHMVRNSLPRFYDFLLDSGFDEIDHPIISALSIPKAEEAPKKKAKTKISKKDKPVESDDPAIVVIPPSKTKIAIIEDLLSPAGFSVKNSTKNLTDRTLIIEAFYNNITGGGDPTKNYSPLDFDFQDSKFKIKTTGCKLQSNEFNTLTLDIQHPTFKVEIHGFDDNHPLFVHVRDQ